MIKRWVRDFAIWLLKWADPGVFNQLQILPGPNLCDVCSTRLSAAAIRTHHGHWRCSKHKGMP